MNVSLNSTSPYDIKNAEIFPIKFGYIGIILLKAVDHS